MIFIKGDDKMREITKKEYRDYYDVFIPSQIEDENIKEQKQEDYFTKKLVFNFMYVVKRPTLLFLLLCFVITMSACISYFHTLVSFILPIVSGLLFYFVTINRAKKDNLWKSE